MNVRSLSCHFDELQSLLVNLNIGFNVVVVSETWDSFARPVSTNVDLAGYTFLSTKSHSQNGGVGLYIKTSLGPVPRPDWSVTVMIMRQFGLKLRTQKTKTF